MKIEDILRMLNYDYYPSDDDLIITWFDKKNISSCLDALPDDQDVLTEAWGRASEQMQECLDGFMDFYRVQYDLAEILKSAIEDVEQEWSKDE
jgi:hypothetical protein